MDPAIGTVHVLLIGIDDYPSSPLGGCVNDIDAIERLLLDPPGVGVPPERIALRRLAAPRPGAPVRSRFADRTTAPTRAAILGALADLAGDAVSAADRVLVYYSGHGAQDLWTTNAWHESLVAADEQPVDDVELNALLAAIAARTEDVTMVLDCCHSSGATREIVRAESGGRAAVRSFEPSWGRRRPPDLAALPGAAAGRGAAAAAVAIDPPYVVLAACLSDETAGEKELAGLDHGNLTRAFVHLMAERDAPARSRLRWADVWSDLVATVHEIAATRPVSAVQNPWLTGRSERRVFGGPWQRREAGFPVTRDGDGTMRVLAGEVMGVTEGAELAVYGPDEPARFEPLGTAADEAARLGRLRVTDGQRARCTVAFAGAAFDVPPGARARLVASGAAERLKVRLEPFDRDLAASLNGSRLLDVAADHPAGAEVVVRSGDGGPWLLGNDVEPRVAAADRGEDVALRAGLESYARYQAALRLAQRCSDPQLANRLRLRLLEVPAAGPPTDDEIDALPEAPRLGGDYALVEGSRFCVEVTNRWSGALNVSLLNCTAGGKVEYLGAVEVQGVADGIAGREVFWLSGEIGRPFEAWASMGRPRATDRVLAVATTRRDVDLMGMAVDDDVQDVIERQRDRDRGLNREIGPRRGRAAPAELWTAQTATVVIYRPGHAPTGRP